MESTYEMRRRAPGHYLSKAQNAHFSAFVLSHLGSDNLAKMAKQTNYSGMPEISTGEAFQREAAIALELIIKAVISQRIENCQAPAHVKKVRPTHDLPSLWLDAQLPKLSDPDQHRLLIVKSILIWSGRYATPNKEEYLKKEFLEQKKYQDVVSKFGELTIIRPRSFDWDDFCRIYSIAFDVFCEL